MGVLEGDVQAGRYTGRDHPRLIAARGGWSPPRQPRGKEQAHPVRPTQVEVLADDRLEELAPLDWAGEDLGETDLQLPEAELVLIAGAPLGRRQRPGEPL